MKVSPIQGEWRDLAHMSDRDFREVIADSHEGVVQASILDNLECQERKCGFCLKGQCLQTGHQTDAFFI